jgi:hypothetical protein
VILEGPSPNVIEIWEAVLTLALFPLLVVIAYYLDVKRTRESNKIAPQSKQVTIISADITHNNKSPAPNSAKMSMQEKIQDLRAQEDAGMPNTDEEDKVVVARLLEGKHTKPPPSRAYYRRLVVCESLRTWGLRSSSRVWRTCAHTTLGLSM